jgi:hypothetical protein
MRIGCLLVVLFVAGCGEDRSAHEPLNLSDGQDYALDQSEEALGFACTSSGTSALSKKIDRGYLPTLELAFENVNREKRPRLVDNANKEQFCDEILDAMLDSTEIDFTFQDTTDAISDAKSPLRFKWVSLTYDDGAMKSHSVNIGLRCESAIMGSCIFKEDGDCREYLVQPPQEVCTFRASSTLFTFSNHKEGVIDVSGQIDFTRDSPLLSITKLSVIGYD